MISSNKVIIIEIEFPLPGSVSGHQICIRILSTIAAVTIKDNSVLKSNDIISSDVTMSIRPQLSLDWLL